MKSVAVLVGLVAALAGCSDPGGEGLVGAPEDWTDFLSWTEARLQSTPAPVPLPQSPQLAQARWTVIRLDDPKVFADARIRCDWTPEPVAGGVAAEVGPVRSDRPGDDATVRVVPGASGEGGDALEMSVGGFDVRREEVGSLELEIRVPVGQWFTLQWGQAGRVAVAIPSHDAPFVVRVATDGLAEWQGRLQRLSILADGVPQDTPLDLRRLRFMRRDASFPDPVAVQRARVGRDLRTAICAHCPAEMTYPGVEVPPSGKLQFGLAGVSGGDGSAASVSFEVLVGEEGDAESVFLRDLEPEDQWGEFTISLDPWSGQRVTLTLRCSSSDPQAVALWANPVLYQPVEDAPVVVVYLIDTLASEHLGLYGYPRDTAPNLAGLAERGVWFANTFANSSRTIESVPDMMLSMPVERHGVWHPSTAAPLELVSLADAVRAAGFATVSFCTNVNAGPRQAMDQGFDTFVDRVGYHWTYSDRTVPLEEVKEWLARHRERPLFVYVHTAEPHAPYTPPSDFGGRFDSDYRGTIDGTFNPFSGFRTIRDPMRKRRDIEHVKALYDEEITYADARFGLFLDVLRSAGRLERTHLFVTSDHGEEFLEHGHWEHGLDLHNEQTRVPLVASGPSLATGRRVDVPVQLVDLMPTILDLLELPAPYALEGSSLVPLLQGEEASAQWGRRQVFATNHALRVSHRMVEHSVIDAGRWKLLWGARWPAPEDPAGPVSRCMLFDLQRDPFELSNVIDNHHDLARRLVGDLVRWREAQRPYDVTGAGPASIDAEHMRELEAMGYVEGPGGE